MVAGHGGGVVEMIIVHFRQQQEKWLVCVELSRSSWKVFEKDYSTRGRAASHSHSLVDCSLRRPPTRESRRLGGEPPRARERKWTADNIIVLSAHFAQTGSVFYYYVFRHDRHDTTDDAGVCIKRRFSLRLVWFASLCGALNSELFSFCGKFTSPN